MERDAQGNIQWDPDRFPSGLPTLINWLHARGLKFGLYTSAGDTTCSQGGRPHPIPGSFGHYEQDAATFAKWGACAGLASKRNHVNIVSVCPSPPERFNVVLLCLLFSGDRSSGRVIFALSPLRSASHSSALTRNPSPAQALTTSRSTGAAAISPTARSSTRPSPRR